MSWPHLVVSPDLRTRTWRYDNLAGKHSEISPAAENGRVRVVSVNVGKPRVVPYETTSLPTTGIEKHPVSGPVRITYAGVEGNAVADTRNHGDEWMRVYAYSVEDYAW